MTKHLNKTLISAKPTLLLKIFATPVSTSMKSARCFYNKHTPDREDFPGDRTAQLRIATLPLNPGFRSFISRLLSRHRHNVRIGVINQSSRGS